MKLALNHGAIINCVLLPKTTVWSMLTQLQLKNITISHSFFSFKWTTFCQYFCTNAVNRTV